MAYWDQDFSDEWLGESAHSAYVREFLEIARVRATSNTILTSSLAHATAGVVRCRLVAASVLSRPHQQWIHGSGSIVR